MDTSDFSKAQGHWILAKMGKKVLRPGGRELTQKLISNLHISSTDEVVEFAPGLGYTASLAIEKQPKNYVGVDADDDAIALLTNKIKGKNIRFIKGNAAETTLLAESKDKVYGEAMLTMHADHRKAEIIREANRILKKGGLYAIHELGLEPENLSEEHKASIQRDLAVAIKVNARPLTINEWSVLLEKEGFRIHSVEKNGMCLLEPKRMIQDEGLMGFMKINWNIIRNRSARKRVSEMQQTYKKHAQNMNALVIVAEKI
jgi:ubiquinone/menaquinone biosynthesis C-methylase UbiE